MIPFRTERLDNGIEVTFVDLSNRYFGDYCRVRVEIRLSVPRPDRDDPLVKSHVLERMAVPSADVEAERNRLVDDYWRHAGRYLTHADYPARLLAAASASRRRGHLQGL